MADWIAFAFGFLAVVFLAWCLMRVLKMRLKIRKAFDEEKGES